MFVLFNRSQSSRHGQRTLAREGFPLIMADDLKETKIWSLSSRRDSDSEEEREIAAKAKKDADGRRGGDEDQGRR